MSREGNKVKGLQTKVKEKKNRGIRAMSQNQKIQKQSDQQTEQVISIRRSAAILVALTLVATTALATLAVTCLASPRSAMIEPVLPAGAVDRARTSAAADAPVREAGRQQGGRDELRVDLSTNGFAPAEVTHAAGSFAITVENVDVTGEYVLRLKGADGALLKEVSVQKGSTSWTVELAAGSYTLVEANHSNWICHLTVE
jgi:hypothetical protein